MLVLDEFPDRYQRLREFDRKIDGEAPKSAEIPAGSKIAVLTCGGAGNHGVSKPLRVLFACVGNSARSQMAQGFASALGGAHVEARSGGSRPLGHVLPEAIQVMREKGIDISGHASRGFDEAWVRDACDLVVTMGCGDDACPPFLGKHLVDWDLPDPRGMDLAGFRKVRDAIEARVRDLLRSRGIPVAEAPA